MKPAPFAYVRPATLSQALAAHAGAAGEARYLAGGQSLVPMLNFRLATPDLLIDLNGLGELSGVRMTDGALWIGALTRHAEVAADPLVLRHLPLLPAALSHVAHPAIRNRGTLGGSLALADPAAEMPACLLALDATICVEGLGGPREIPATDFFRGTYATALAEGEILTGVRLPLPLPGTSARFGELAIRHGDFAMVGVVVIEGPAPRVVWFGLGDHPQRDPGAEAELSAGPTQAAAAALGGITVHDTPEASARVKAHQARALLKRVLEGAPCR